MSHRTIAWRLRRRGALLALPVAVGAIALAGAPSALADSICPASDAATLLQCVTNANAAGAGFTIITITANTKLTGLTGPYTLNGHTEITGPPTLQVPLNGTTDAQINGTGDTTLTSQDLFRVSGNVIFKSVDMNLCGSGTAFACVHVLSGGHAEFDNMAFEQANGLPLIVDSGGTATVNESSVVDGAGNGPTISGTANFNNVTISDNNADGIVNQAGSTVNLNNTVIDFNNTGAGAGRSCAAAVQSAANSQADDPSCGTNVTVPAANTACPTTLGSAILVAQCRINLGASNFNGGPTETQIPADPAGTFSGSTSGASSLTGAGNALTCAVSDQRFFLKTPGSCDIGAYQSTGAHDTETTGPMCKVTALSETSPASEQVTITDGMSGIGPDAVSFTTTGAGITSTFSGGAGTIAWPVIAGTLFDQTSPGGSSPALQDFPNNATTGMGAGFVVTATKLAADTTVNDTKWSFDATNWLGLTTFCA
jgi:hypothetical protein